MLLLALLLVLLPAPSLAQWAGSTTTSGSIYRDGAVGIGTTAPLYPLHVDGDILLADDIPVLRLVARSTSQYSSPRIELEHAEAADGNRWRILAEKSAAGAGTGRTIFILTRQDAVNAWYHYLKIDPATNDIVFNATSKDGAPMGDLVLRTGNLGVGTLSPDHRLDVDGTARAREVIVESDWADHVFADDYPLLPLDALARYVEQHRHLPGVPTADEVRAEGLRVGESQALLLEKIEELTLYLVAQHRRIEALETRLDAAPDAAPDPACTP